MFYILYHQLQLASTMLHKAKTQLQKGVEPGKDFQELLLSSLVKLRVVQSAKANPQQARKFFRYFGIN